MSTFASASGGRSTLANLGTAVLVGAVGLATVVGGVASGGNLVATLAPMLLVALVFVLTRAPLRWPAYAVVFLTLALEVSGDASGLVTTPLVHLGNLLVDSSGLETGLRISGVEVLFLALLGVSLWRKATGSTIDGAGHVRAPSLARDAVVLLLAGFLYSEVLSLAGGHGLSFWKARSILHSAMLFGLFQTTLRGPGDFKPVGWAVVSAAHLKALLAAWVQLVAAPRLTGGQLAFATNHGDSVLFVMALFIVLIPALEGVGRRAWLRCLLLMPIPFWGIMLNHRRIAYAMLELGLVLVFLLGTWRPWKRRLLMGLALGAPMVALYVGIGWNGGDSSIFGPVRKVRTLVDSKVDGSTYWREVEAWNIARSLGDSSLLGVGLGGEYREYMFNDDISAGYPDYRGWPHNTVLGLLLYAGVIGFVGIWAWNLVIMFLATRTIYRSRLREHRAMALTCVTALVCMLVMAWGDTGSHFWQHKLAGGLVMAFVGKLAVASGAWEVGGPGVGAAAGRGFTSRLLRRVSG